MTMILSQILSHPPVSPRSTCSRPNEAGFSFLETMIATGILAVMFLGLGAMMTTGAGMTRTVRQESSLLSKAQELADACRVMTFGTVEDPDAEEDQVVEALNGDPFMGTVTLQALSQLPQNRIEVSTDDQSIFPDGFPVHGTFFVRVERFGNSILQSARTRDVDFSTILKTDGLPDEAALRIVVTFRKRGEDRERLLLRTFVVNPEIPVDE